MRQKSRARTIAAIVLSLPFLLLFVAFDLAKLPVLIVLSPLWGLMDLISWLRGEELELLLFPMLCEMSVMGISLWMELVGIRQPRWMGGF